MSVIYCRVSSLIPVSRLWTWADKASSLVVFWSVWGLLFIPFCMQADGGPWVGEWLCTPTGLAQRQEPGGMLLGVCVCVPQLPTHLAALMLLLGMCRDTVPEGGTPGPLTCAGLGWSPEHPQRWMCAGCVVQTHLGGLRAPHLHRLRALPWFVPGAKVHPRARECICVPLLTKLGFELSLGPSFLPAHMPPRRALAGTFSNAQAGLRQSPVHMLSYTGLKEEGLLLEGRVSHCRRKSCCDACPLSQWTSLALFKFCVTEGADETADLACVLGRVALAGWSCSNRQRSTEILNVITMQAADSKELVSY